VRDELGANARRLHAEFARARAHANNRTTTAPVQTHPADAGAAISVGGCSSACEPTRASCARTLCPIDARHMR
jgi:hypothetical protein